jgi:hypothetical protein
MVVSDCPDATKGIGVALAAAVVFEDSFRIIVEGSYLEWLDFYR